MNSASPSATPYYYCCSFFCRPCPPKEPPPPPFSSYAALLLFLVLITIQPMQFDCLVHLFAMLSSLDSHDHPSRRHPSSSSSDHSRQLLINCAELVHRLDIPAARRALSLLLSSSSPFADSTDRVVHQFTLALSLRLSLLPSPPPNNATLQSSYLSLNQITPFLRFAHLTANQAILEAVAHSSSIHILDLDTSHGLQWPPLLQAIADRSHPADPPSIRITGTGPDLSVLRRTAHRLESFAVSLGLPFRFHPLLLPSPTSNNAAESNFSAFQLHPGETLAVNCVMFLNKMMKDSGPFDADGSREARAFLRAVRAMNPAVVTLAEREASHNSLIFLQRFMEALDHYTAVFESLEATLPPASGERLAVEQVWFGREIADVVAAEGEGRRERSQRFERWEGLMRSAGFGSRALSPFALSQARLLLRLHYPSEGYQLKMVRNAFFLGWQNKPLFSVSSWR